MFDYFYWPEATETELKKQIKFFNHQAQMVLEGEMLLDLAPAILRAQMEGKYFELIVFLQSGFKAMEVANLLHRMVNSGARIGIIEGKFDSEHLEIFGVFDNKLLVSNFYYEESILFIDLIRQKHKDFDLLLRGAEMVNLQSQPIKLTFSSSQYFVRKGEKVELSWKAQNSTHQIINPYPGEVENEGKYQCLVENDTLFTIQAKNIKNSALLSIFIKCIDDDHIKAIISVYNSELTQYIAIDPIPDDASIYAVYKGDLVRVEWLTYSGSKLSEASMGNLKNTDFTNFVAKTSTKFEFKLQVGDEFYHKNITVFTLPDTSISTLNHELNSMEKDDLDGYGNDKEASWKGWINKLIGSKKDKR